MKIVRLTFEIDDEMNLHAIVIDRNDTNLKDDSKLIKNLAIATLKGIYSDREDVELQDIYNELGIKKPDK